MPDPLGNLVLRYARTHAPFAAVDVATRYGLTVPAVEAVLSRLTGDGRVLEGEFRPGGRSREWTDPGVLRMLRHRSLAKLRHQVEPVEQAVLGRFTATWHGVVKKRRGADSLLDAIEQLQGAPIPASILETEILPARIEGYDPADLDAIAAAGEVVWIGVEPLGERDGRIALYLADHLARLLPPQVHLKAGATSARVKANSNRERGRPHSDTAGKRGDRQRVAGGRISPDHDLNRSLQADDRPDQQPRSDRDLDSPDPPDRETAILASLTSHGASFFGPLHEAAGKGFPAETVRALWNLVWSGLVTNDTFHALRAFTRARSSRPRHGHVPASSFRSRRLVPRSAEGRWTLVTRDGGGEPAATATRATAWITAVAQQLLVRHGVVTRESLAFENIPGGFSTIYPVLKLMEESGRLRRGYFVTGLGATQFALPGAVDRLRSLRDAPEVAEVAVLAATDPANPYGATLPWSRLQSTGTRASPRKLRRPGTISAAPVSSLVVDPAPTSVPRAREGAETANASSGGDAAASAGRGPTRSVGATVILVNGALAAYLARGDRLLLSFLPEAEPERSNTARAIAGALNERARSAGVDGPRGMLIEEINGGMPAADPLAPYLVEAGFVAGALGFQPNFRL